MSFFGVRTEQSKDSAQVYDYGAPEGSEFDKDHDTSAQQGFGPGYPGWDPGFGGRAPEDQISYERGSQVPSLAPLASLWGPQQGQHPQQHALSVHDIEQQMMQQHLSNPPNSHPGQPPIMPYPPMYGAPPGMYPGGPPGPVSNMYPPQGMYQPWGYQQPGVQPQEYPQHGFTAQDQPFERQAPYEQLSQPQPPSQEPDHGQQIHSSGERSEVRSEVHGEQSRREKDTGASKSSQNTDREARVVEGRQVKHPLEPDSGTEPYSLAKRNVPATSLAEARSRALAHQQDGGRQDPRELQRSDYRERRGGGHYRNSVRDHAPVERAPNASNVKFRGLMGEWDKNFILRVQLQQLISQDPFNEDFYYQVYTAIQARSNSQQPLSHFARTYLFQRGQRYRRGQNRNENPLQRMQQQVQDVVERVRGRTVKEPERRENTLGQGAGGGGAARPRKSLSLPLDTLETKSRQDSDYTFDDIRNSAERAYDAILELEAHERARPPPDHEDAAAWAEKIPVLREDLWNELRVKSPLDKKGQQPFIMVLSLDKGKKLLPRAFPHLDNNARLTVLTRIFHMVDDIDVIRDGAYTKEKDLTASTRRAVDLFSQTVLQPLVQYISELDLELTKLLLDMLLSSSRDIVHVANTKIGQAFFTVLISRAELIKQESVASDSDLTSWSETFDRLFVKLEPHLASLFPPQTVENTYVWNFLAALALAANLDHQRLLVNAVRDRIFGTMAEAKTLPEDAGAAKIANLNLFLNVMGLNATYDDVTALQSE